MNPTMNHHTNSYHVIASRSIPGPSIATTLLPNEIQEDIAMIKKVVCDELSVLPEEFESKSRAKGTVLARHYFYLTAYELLHDYKPPITYKALGQCMDIHQDHATVLHGMRKLRDIMSIPGGGDIKEKYIILRKRCSALLGAQTVDELQRRLQQTNEAIRELQERKATLEKRIKDYITNE